MTFHLLETLSVSRNDKGLPMEFHVPEMSCGHCSAAITKEITTLDPGAKVTADFDRV